MVAGREEMYGAGVHPPGGEAVSRCKVYYNDSGPFVCAWLRNLIAAGLIPAGDVDERPIGHETGPTAWARPASVMSC